MQKIIFCLNCLKNLSVLCYNKQCNSIKIRCSVQFFAKIDFSRGFNLSNDFNEDKRNKKTFRRVRRGIYGESEMKFLKLLFSKAFVIGVLFILQVALILSVYYYFSAHYVAIAIIFSALSVLAFLSVVNRKENPEFKLPWIVIFFLFPFFGITVYVFFAHPKLSKKYEQRLSSISAEISLYDKATEQQKERVMHVLETHFDIEKYLSTTAHMNGRVANDVKYYSCGEDFLKDLLIDLDGAKSFIFLEYFIITPGQMWEAIHEILLRKIREGVEVKIIYDDIGTLGKLKSNFYSKLCKEGIQCYKFNPFRPVLSGIYNNRDHRKIAVIDGKTGYTGGVNIGDEYINRISPYGHWKDSCIRIRGSAVNNLSSMFLQMYDMTAGSKSDYKRYLDVEHTEYDCEGYVNPFGDGPRPYFSEQIGEGNFINMINAAKNYLYISTPYLIIDNNITTAIRNAAFRGVDVRIITPHIPDKKIIFNMTRSNYPYLTESGVKIYEYEPGFIHAKMLIADDVLAFVGTINLDYRSLVHHYECGAVLYKTPCIKDIKKDFDDTIKKSILITPENFKIGKLESVINAVLNLFSPML